VDNLPERILTEMKKIKKVSLVNFNSIVDIAARERLLREAGSFIDERIIYGKYAVKIYSIFGFLGEVWINLKKSEVEKVVALPNQLDWELFLSGLKPRDY
jgi:hypothetical protein